LTRWIHAYSSWLNLQSNGYLFFRHLVIVPSSKLSANYPLVGFSKSGHSVKVASVIVVYDSLTPSEIHKLFEQLRDTSSSRSPAFAFVFSCNGHTSSSQYDVQGKVEVREFMSVFPGVPLLGICGCIAVGHRHLPRSSHVIDTNAAEAGEPAAKRSRPPPTHVKPNEDYLRSLSRGFASIYVLVSVAVQL